MVLTKPVIHLRRPDMQGWDGWLHVHPFAQTEVGLAMIFNPTSSSIDTTISLPLYYTGLQGSVAIAEGFGGVPKTVKLKRGEFAEIQLKMEPRTITFFVISRVDGAIV